MELIRISSRKLKLMLTPTDMSHFELNTETIGEDLDQTHRSFRLLLSELRQRIGFDADDRHLSVQYFPSREGGCELFICNLTENEATEEDTAMRSQDRNALELRSPKRANDCFRREFAYRFDHLNDLLAVCDRLHRIGYICESAAFRDGRGRYYLLLTALAPSPFSTPDELCFMVEYGSMENAGTLSVYLREHATLISAPAAISQLASLA
ncbi:MAG: adaptor protein MecA [Clostridia bacterium]|nr:adaptor protein MecA [Clostridia bacterium]